MKKYVFTFLSIFIIQHAFAQWHTEGYGGGGAMFYPEVSPFNANFAFVSCDMSGSYVTYNGGASWRMFNLRGPVNFYVFDPRDSNTVYANSIGLFKSTNKGKTWSLFYPAPAEITGVVAKGDHAQERLVTKDGTLRNVQAFAIDPADSKKMYAVVGIDKKSILLTTNNGGISWSKKADLNYNAKNIFIDPSSNKNNRTFFITHDQGVTTSKGNKLTFNKAPQQVNKLMHFTGGFDKSRNK